MISPDFFIPILLEKTIIASRKHLMVVVETYPDHAYERLSKLLKLDSDILDIVFLRKDKYFHLLKYAPGELKNYKEFLLKLINRTEKGLGFVDDSLLNDPTFLKSAIIENPKIIPFVYEQFQVIYENDRSEFDRLENLYQKAVRSQDYETVGKHKPLVSILNLHRAGKIISQTITKVLPAEDSTVRQINYQPDLVFDRAGYLITNGMGDNDNLDSALPFVSHETILYRSDFYRHDNEVALKLLKYYFATYTLSSKKEVEYILQQLSIELKSDTELASEVLRINGLLLELFSDSIRSDFKMVSTAITNNADAYFLSDSKLRDPHGPASNKNLLIKALELKPDIFLHVPKEWRMDTDLISIIKRRKPCLIANVNE